MIIVVDFLKIIDTLYYRLITGLNTRPYKLTSYKHQNHEPLTAL